MKDTLSYQPSSRYRSKLRVLLATLPGWRHSMFWKMLPIMFVAAFIYAAVLSTIGTVREDGRLQQALAPAALEDGIRHSLNTMPVGGPGASFQAWCDEALPIVAERLLAKRMADRAGDDNVNGFAQGARAGRLAVSLRQADGSSCTFPARDAVILPALLQTMDAAAGRAANAPAGTIVEQSDGWISAGSVALSDGAQVVTAGVHILSPIAKLTHPRSVFKNIAIFVANVSVMTALVFLLLFLRRIKRAFRAAEAWTSGDLSMRIGDTGRDEFSRLTQKFDLMADAMSGVIRMKQSLAAAEERNRLARDLHDSAKQRAFALNLQLTAARKVMPSNAPEGKLIDAALTLTNQLQQDLSAVIQRLAAPTVAESGFRHSLIDSVERLLAGSRISLSVILVEEDEALFDAKPELAGQLLLITTEAVANILKHAHGSHCTISGRRAGERYTWTIADNGIGFSSSDDSIGMGLGNMKIRAQDLPDGRLDLRSFAGTGAEVIVTFRLTG